MLNLVSKNVRFSWCKDILLFFFLNSELNPPALFILQAFQCLIIRKPDWLEQHFSFPGKPITVCHSISRDNGWGQGAGANLILLLLLISVSAFLFSLNFISLLSVMLSKNAGKSFQYPRSSESHLNSEARRMSLIDTEAKDDERAGGSQPRCSLWMSEPPCPRIPAPCCL